MSFIARHLRLILVAVSCAALGAGASAIATAGASPSHPGALRAGRWAAHGLRSRRLRRLLGRTVHADLVVATKRGFVNVTVDRGKVDSVSGQQLTITEGRRPPAQRTVTLTIPAGALVRNDRRRAALSSVAPGERVLVIAAPKRTYVLAHTPRSGR